MKIEIAVKQTPQGHIGVSVACNRALETMTPREAEFSRRLKAVLDNEIPKIVKETGGIATIMGQGNPADQ